MRENKNTSQFLRMDSSKADTPTVVKLKSFYVIIVTKLQNIPYKTNPTNADFAVA